MQIEFDELSEEDQQKMRNDQEVDAILAELDKEEEVVTTARLGHLHTVVIQIRQSRHAANRGHFDVKHFCKEYVDVLCRMLMRAFAVECHFPPKCVCWLRVASRLRRCERIHSHPWHRRSETSRLTPTGVRISSCLYADRCSV